MPGVGDEFRAAREARHLSLSDVSERIHIRSLYLQNIEDGDASFAAAVYVRGFLRTYARFLGLDPEAAVARFNVSVGEAVSPKAHEPIAALRGTRSRAPSAWLWLFGVVTAVLVGFVAYRYFELQSAGDGAAGHRLATIGNATSPPARLSASPTPVPKAVTPAVAGDAKPTLSVRVTRDSWISVKIDGAPVLEGIVKAGSTKSFHGKTAAVRAGNAGGVDLTVNGKELGRMGNFGDVVERDFRLAVQE